jgi:hypothetical protein
MVKAEPLLACTVPESLRAVPRSAPSEWGLSRAVKAHGETRGRHVPFGLGDCERSVMED